MVMRQTAFTPTIRAPEVKDRAMATALNDMARQIEFWLKRAVQQIDEQRGNRGTPTFNADVNLQGNKLRGVGDPEADDDVLPAGLGLRRPTSRADFFDANGLVVRNASDAIGVTELVNLGQLQRMVQPASDIVGSSFITADPEAALPNERTLDGQTNVISLTDNGANNTLLIGVANNGIGNLQLRQGGATSVIGRSANSTGNVADIAASASGNVLWRNGTTLAFAALPIDVLATATALTFTATGTGFTANPTGTARYYLVGSLVFLFLPELTGTSNATSFTITGMPAGITPTRTSYQVVPIVDNSVAAFGLVRLNASSTTIDLFPNAAAGNWTNANTKTSPACWLCYALA
jgi:hypothetical protein